MTQKQRIATVVLWGCTALFSFGALAAEGCNLSATDGVCAEASTPSAAPTQAAGNGYHAVGLTAKGAGDGLASFAPANAGATGSTPAGAASGLSLPFISDSGPASPFAWIFALGFLAVVILRRTRPGAFNLNG